MPRVLFVLPSFAIGGAETKIRNLLMSLAPFEKILLTNKAVSGLCSDLEMPVYYFDDYMSVSADILSPKNIWAYAKAIREVAKSEIPDIILGVMHSGGLFVTVAHDIFFMNAHPVITIEGNITGYFESIGRRPSRKEILILRYCFKRARGIIVPSEGVGEDLIANYGANHEKVKTIYNGIDIERVRALSEEEIPYIKACPWIVTACRLSTGKDFPTLLRAFKIVRDTINAKLFIVGDGELSEEIRRLTLELKLNEDVVMTGFERNPFKFISKGDVFVLSSLHEGFGNVIIEAMALGVPVVCTDCPSGPREIIKNGSSGILVPIGDVQGLSDACLSILKYRDLKERLKYGGLERAEDFSFLKMSRQYSDYLMSVL